MNRVAIPALVAALAATIGLVTGTGWLLAVAVAAALLAVALTGAAIALAHTAPARPRLVDVDTADRIRSREQIAALTDDDWAALEAAGADVSWRPRAPDPGRDVRITPRDVRPRDDRLADRAAAVRRPVRAVRFRVSCPTNRCDWTAVVDDHADVQNLYNQHTAANPACAPRRRSRRPRL